MDVFRVLLGAELATLRVVLGTAFAVALLAEGFTQRRHGHSIVRALLQALRIALIVPLAAGMTSGIGFRIVLRILAWVDADPFTEFTLSGTSAVIGICMLFSAPFGLLFVALRHVLPGTGWRQGLLYGLFLLLYPGLPFLFVGDVTGDNPYLLG